MPESAKSYFSIFDNIFTLNYDNTIEKLTKHTVFHLHGEYSTKSISEDPHNVLGYCRKQNRKSIWFPPQFKHCNCNAILDFSGNRKYNFATRETKAFLEFEKFKESVSNNKSHLGHMLEKFPVEQQQIIQSGVEKDLQCGHNYHFQDFEQLTGTLTIIGLDPKNDRHIFSCINKSNIEEIVFNHYFGEKSKDEVNEIIKNMTLPINKPYKIENVQDIWDEIKVCKPEKRAYELSEAQIDVLNALCYRNPITMDEISLELKSIPTFTKKVIFETMSHEISKSQYHTTPASEEKLFQHFIDFGNTIQPVSISPQALYCLYLTRMQSDKIKRTHKSSKGLKK